MNQDQNKYRPYIWFGIIGAFLAVINSILATLTLGVFQGPLVAFTTPFAFALAKFMYPKKMGATLIYIPVILTSIFTLNFGPPGFYKIVYIIGAILYDLIGYALLFHKQKSPNYKIWKLIVAVIFYPVGLFAGAYIAITWIITDIEIPFLSKGLIGALMMIVLFMLVGTFATHISYKIYKKFLHRELTDYNDEN